MIPHSFSNAGEASPWIVFHCVVFYLGMLWMQCGSLWCWKVTLSKWHCMVGQNPMVLVFISDDKIANTAGLNVSTKPWQSLLYRWHSLLYRSSDLHIDNDLNQKCHLSNFSVCFLSLRMAFGQLSTETVLIRLHFLGSWLSDTVHLL